MSSDSTIGKSVGKPRQIVRRRQTEQYSTIGKSVGKPRLIAPSLKTSADSTIGKSVGKPRPVTDVPCPVEDSTIGKSAGKPRLMGYPLKAPCRDGTTHVRFEPQDFIARLAALAPEPRVHLTRCHGVFTANSKHRIQVTPGKRGKGGGHSKVAANHWLEKTPEEWHRAMTWMQRLKHVFGIDIETCERCGRTVKVMASIEAPAVIAPILKHLQQKAALKAAIPSHERPPERAPPMMRRFDEHFQLTRQARRVPFVGQTSMLGCASQNR